MAERAESAADVTRLAAAFAGAMTLDRETRHARGGHVEVDR